MARRHQADTTAEKQKVVWLPEMNVGEIRHIYLKEVKYDVLDVSSEVMASHAGIFVSYKDENIIGGRRLSGVESDVEQDFMLLAFFPHLCCVK